MHMLLVIGLSALPESVILFGRASGDIYCFTPVGHVIVTEVTIAILLTTAGGPSATAG